jgi:Crinkler effector protein N-terminal domain
MSTTIKLWCWVYGDDLNRIFPVEIASTESVGDLKEAIKIENQLAFRHIGANALHLWGVSIDFDANLKRSLDDFDVDREPRLLPWTKLSSVFPDLPTGDCLNIIINVPAPSPAGKCRSLGLVVSMFHFVFTLPLTLSN